MEFSRSVGLVTVGRQPIIALYDCNGGKAADALVSGLGDRIAVRRFEHPCTAQHRESNGLTTTIEPLRQVIRRVLQQTC